MLSVERFLWGGGRVRRALGLGAPFGAFMGVGLLGEHPSHPGPVIVGAVIAGAFFGLVTERLMVRRWPGSRVLAPADRVAVVQASARGEGLTDARLAPEIIAFATAMQRGAAIDTRLGWVTGWAPRASAPGPSG